MQRRDPVVVALEEREEVLREVVLVEVRQRADDPEIERDIAPELRRIETHLDIAGVHVRMEKAVAEHLREEDLDAFARELRNIDASRAQRIDLADRHADHPLHHEHARRAELPVHLRHEQQIEPDEIAPQLAAVRGFAHQVEFVVQIFVEFGDDFARLQPFTVGPQALRPDSEVAQQRQVGVDHGQHVRPQHFDRHRLASMRARLHLREVHLGDRRARHRNALELVEEHVDRRAQRFFDDADRDLRVERRHLVLQLREFVGDIDRQQVATRRQHLPELHEDRPETFERKAQPNAGRPVEPAAEGRDAHQEPHAAVVDAAQHHLVEAEADDGEHNFDEAQKTHEQIR